MPNDEPLQNLSYMIGENESLTSNFNEFKNEITRTINFIDKKINCDLNYYQEENNLKLLNINNNIKKISPIYFDRYNLQNIIIPFEELNHIKNSIGFYKYNIIKSINNAIEKCILDNKDSFYIKLKREIPTVFRYSIKNITPVESLSIIKSLINEYYVYYNTKESNIDEILLRIFINKPNEFHDKVFKLHLKETDGYEFITNENKLIETHLENLDRIENKKLHKRLFNWITNLITINISFNFKKQNIFNNRK